LERSSGSGGSALADFRDGVQQEVSENEPIFNAGQETPPGVSGEMAITNPFSMLARAPF
jgi:hypothetical protein